MKRQKGPIHEKTKRTNQGKDKKNQPMKRQKGPIHEKTRRVKTLGASAPCRDGISSKALRKPKRVGITIKAKVGAKVRVRVRDKIRVRVGIGVGFRVRDRVG
jgi:hypothetical protein